MEGHTQHALTDIAGLNSCTATSIQCVYPAALIPAAVHLEQLCYILPIKARIACGAYLAVARKANSPILPEQQRWLVVS